MTPFTFAFLIGGYLSMGLAWFRGGTPERWGALIWIGNWLLAGSLQDVRRGAFLIGVAVADVLALAAMIWLALRYDRWWTLASAAAMALWAAVHLSAMLNPGLSYLGVVSALLGPYLLGVLLLGLGVLERWMAGERAADSLARWLP